MSDNGELQPPQEQPGLVARPPEEAAGRVANGGPWGPTDFDLPDPRGDQFPVLMVSVVGGLVLVLLVGVMTIFYFNLT